MLRGLGIMKHCRIKVWSTYDNKFYCEMIILQFAHAEFQLPVDTATIVPATTPFKCLNVIFSYMVLVLLTLHS